MNYEIKEELVNATLQYLGSKPFVEVAGLITELKKLNPIKEVEDS